MYLMRKLGVPKRLYELLLRCQAFTIPGWSGWVKYQSEADAQEVDRTSDFAGLLAIRLAYDAAR